MPSRIALLGVLPMFLGACAGAAKPEVAPAPAASSPGSARPQPSPSPGSDAALAALDIEMDAGNDGVAALSQAALKAGCKVQRKTQKGHPSLIAECSDGLFGAVQVDTTLSIRCVDMAEADCELFVLAILDAGEPGSSPSPPSPAAGDRAPATQSVPD